MPTARAETTSASPAARRRPAGSPAPRPLSSPESPGRSCRRVPWAWAPLVGRHLAGADTGLAHGRDLFGALDGHEATVARQSHELIAGGDHLERVGGGAVVDPGRHAVTLARLDDLQLCLHDRRVGLIEPGLAAHREREIRR